MGDIIEFGNKKLDEGEELREIFEEPTENSGNIEQGAGSEKVETGRRVEYPRGCVKRS
jgi:hypothetical protein